MYVSTLVAAVARRLDGVRGRGRLGQRWATRHTDVVHDWNVTMRRGYVITGPVSSSQMWTAAFTGEYAEPVVDLLEPFMEAGSIVLDIGASLGLFTVPLVLAANAAGASRVIAYEPVQGNLTYLRYNIAQNGLEGRTCIRPVALGNFSGTTEAHVEGLGAGNAAITSGVDPLDQLNHDRQGNLRETAIIEIVTLDNELEKFDGSCSVVKIDVEGFEMAVLAGAERLFAKCRPVILGEFNPDWLRSRGVSLEAPYQWCTMHDYRVFSLSGVRRHFWTDARMSLRPFVPELPRRDLLLVPRERDSVIYC